MEQNAEMNCVSSATMRVLLKTVVTDLIPTLSSWKGYQAECKKLHAVIDALGTKPAFYTQVLPKLGKLLDSKLACSELWERNARLADVENIVGYPSFMDWFFRIIFRDGRQEPRSGEVVGFVRQVCYLFYKLRGGESVESHKEALDEFVHRDASLGSNWFVCSKSTNRSSSILRLAKVINCLSLGSVNLQDIIPRHGPGAVANGEKPWEKMNFKRFIPRLDEEYPYSEYFFLNSQHLCDNLNDFLQMEECDPPSRVVLVPKDSRGPRIIAAEPLELQWIQQGIMRTLVKHIEQHPLTRGQVWFSNQKPHQELARQSSITGDYVTLDLKDASDLVSMKLVESLFPTHIYRKICACRSKSTVLPDGRTVEFKKFAAMGSALCFPIMAMSLFSLCVATSLIARQHSGSYSIRAIEAACKDIYVFGDDLIVPRALFKHLVEVFADVELKFNMNKCCVGPYFRESCGTDWFRGYNVTPIRIKTLYPSNKSPESVLSTVAYANAFAKARCFGTAHTLGNMVENHYRLPRASSNNDIIDFMFERTERDGLPLTLPCVDAKASYRHNSKHFAHRFNIELQRNEWKVWVLATTTKVVNSGWSEYFRWHVNHGTEFVAHRYTIPHRIKIIQRWAHI